MPLCGDPQHASIAGTPSKGRHRTRDEISLGLADCAAMAARFLWRCCETSWIGATPQRCAKSAPENSGAHPAASASKHRADDDCEQSRCMRKRRRYPVRLLCLRFVLAALFRYRRSQTLLNKTFSPGPERNTFIQHECVQITLFLLIINTSSISASSATKLIDNKGTYTTHSAVPAVCTELYSATLLATLLPIMKILCVARPR